MPSRYRLPLVVLDATGMRIGELEQLTWGDVDEQRNRWRVSQAASKTRRARWVQVPPVIFQAVTALVPREDRAPVRRVFQGFGADRFRTAITRACVAAGVPTFPASRPTASTHLAPASRWHAVGSDRRARRPAEPCRDCEHVHTHNARRDRARLPGAARLTGCRFTRRRATRPRTLWAGVWACRSGAGWLYGDRVRDAGARAVQTSVQTLRAKYAD